ncbi:hypothetical protein FQN49_001836 [Arthroderma sp. PD_2]|nr:hypothetical protein FQN49_001836 [Arthroderma sp. PD_2]
MELAGLVIGVAGLFGTCMDILNRVSSYREFSTQSRQTIVSFEANKTRLKDWADRVGIEDGVLRGDHHVCLDKPDIRSAVKSVLEEISGLFDSIEHTQSRLRLPRVAVSPAASSVPTSPNNSGSEKTAGPKSSIRGGIGWALKRKESFISQVEVFGEFVDMLHKLVPKEQDGSDAFVEDFKALLEETRHNSLLQMQKRADEWLDAAITDQQYETHISARLDGTCNWITNDSAYKAWESDHFPGDTAKFLWICGPAGSGKSVLCARIIQQFNEKPNRPVAFFFSTGHVQTGGSPDGIVRSWVSQAARRRGEILELVQQAMNQSEAGRRASQSDVWTLFREIATSISNFTFVLDGLDEYDICDGGRAQVLQKLKEQARSTKSRVLVVSRDEVDLNQELCAAPQCGENITMLECKVTKTKIRPEIQLYSESIINKQLAKKGASLRQELATQMAEKCGGMFLWIKMQQGQLRGGKNEKQLRNIVTTMPSGLYQIYERNWLNIQRRPADERRRAIAILRWATFAFRPLTVSEITEAVAILGGDEDEDEDYEDNDDLPEFPMDELPDDIDDEYINGEIKDLCGSLIEVRYPDSDTPKGSGTIHIVHASVKEYLFLVLGSTASLPNIGSLSLRSPSPTLQHSILAKICLRYLTFPEVWTDDAFPKYGESHVSFLAYAAASWDQHKRAAGKDVGLTQRINQFFSKSPCFSQWARHYEATHRRYSEKPFAHASPLYYSSLLGLFDTASFLLTETKVDPNAVAGRFGTALQAASVNGSLPVVELLIDYGADVTLEGGKYGSALNAAAAFMNEQIISHLITNGAKLDSQNTEGQTAVHFLATNGNIALLAHLQHAGADMGMADKNGVTPLHLASRGSIEVVKFLIENGADIAAITSKGETPLYYACERNNLEIAKLLLSRGASAAVGPLLVKPAANGKTRMVQLLLRAGADIEAEIMGKTPLYAASAKGYTKITKLLLDKGANTESVNYINWRPLYAASHNGHVWTVKALVEKGACLTAANNHGSTALHAASELGHACVVKILLDAGADPARVNGWKRSALDMAAEMGHELTFKVLMTKARVVSGNHRFGTLLNAIAYGGSLNLIRLIIEGYGLDCDYTDDQNRNAAHLAARGGHVEILKYLLEKGIDPQSTDSTGRGIVHYAACGGSAEAVRMALAALPPGSEISKSVWSPLHWACRAGSIEIVNILREYGVQDSTVTTHEPDEIQWTPYRIALFHLNTDLVKRWGQKTDSELAQGRFPTGHYNSGFICDGCQHEICGPRFYSRVQASRMFFCLMCKLSSDTTRPHREWKLQEEYWYE